MKRGQLRSLLACLVMCAVTSSHAQPSFAYTTVLHDVVQPGFYKIILQPQVVARCRNGLNDIRILDSKNRQVPYILKADLQQFHGNDFIEFPILSVTRQNDKLTHVVISNVKNRTISELLLVIRNADAERSVTISGSDDNQQWFIIKEYILLSNLYATGGDRFIQSLSFPSSSYRFFKVILNGKGLLPVNITKAGIPGESLQQGNYLPVPAPAVTQKDSTDKASYIALNFNEAYQVDKLELTVTGARFYHRSFSVASEDGYTYPVAAGLLLRSGSVPAYAVNIKARKLSLVIQNEDNPPLAVSGVKAYQLSRYLLAYLENPGLYRMVFGDSSAAAPLYDLEVFKDSIKNNIATIQAGPVITNSAAPVVASINNNKHTAVLWAIIVLVLGVLIYFTLRMTREINNKSL